MDDTFSDDGWDDLNDDTLQALENHAIQLTQAQRLPGQTQTQSASVQNANAPAQTQGSDYDYGFEDDDLDDTDVIDQLAQQPARPPAAPNPLPPAQAQNRVVSTLAGQQRWNQQQQQQRGLAGSTGFPARSQFPTPTRAIPSIPPLQGPNPSRPVPIPASRPRSQFVRPPLPSQFARPPPPNTRPYPPPRSQLPVAAGHAQNEILAALRVQVSELERELMSSKGEAGILRKNLDKARAEHEAELARLRKLNAEQLQKHERAVDAAVAAQRTAATELEFTRRDLKDELGRAAKAKKRDGAATPPRKNRSFVADGFDDLEILPSPGRAAGQKRRDVGGVAIPVADRTPTKGKRKRPVVDSPVNALEIHSDDVVMLEGDTDKASTAAVSGFRAHELPFDFLKLVLDHSPHHNQPLTFELFSRYAFPSSPSQTFAALIFSKLPQMGSPEHPLRLLVDFLDLVLDMWARCLAEKYHAPIYDLAALVLFTLQLNTLDIAPHVASALVPLVQNTCSLVAMPRVQSPDGDVARHPDPVVRQLAVDIDMAQPLALLYLVALGCLAPPSSQTPARSPQTDFWTDMQPEFVLLLLSPKQPEADILAMLALLRTSATRTSIGPIPLPSSPSALPPSRNQDLRTQDGVARAVLDRVSHHAADPPRWPGVRDLQCRFRLAALRTLRAFAASPYGLVQIAASAVVIPRLVTLLCWALDRLYDVDVPAAIWEGKKKKGAGAGGGDEANNKEEVLDVSKTVSVTESRTVSAGESMQIDEPAVVDEPAAPAAAPDPGGGIVYNDDAEEGDEEDAVFNDDDPTPLLQQLIAQLVQLLHTLVTHPRTAALAAMAAKLGASHGGAQRYLLTLARLSFAEEDLVLEAGIDAETVERAHELLELAVTPEEGEAIGEVFGG